MTNKLSEKEIEAIRKRADKATEGPWWASEGLYVVNNLTGDSYEWDADFVAETERESDAEFIAHAREDIPKLLAEIERLRSGLEALDKDISACLAYKLPFELIEISGYINDILHGGDDE